MKLIQLENGDWIDPTRVVRVHAAHKIDRHTREPADARLVVVLDREGTESHIRYESFGKATLARDDLAAWINRVVEAGDEKEASRP